ncbi:MAG: ankyrin repeat domain-containing protein [Alphaproteobacteria bacterium]
MHVALRFAAGAALILFGFLAGLFYFAGQSPRLAVEPRTPSEPYSELTARINAALKNNEPERMAKAAAARGDQRFLASASTYPRIPRVDCVLTPPARRIDAVSHSTIADVIIVLGANSSDPLGTYRAALSEYLARYNNALVEARDYTDGDLCVLKPESETAAEDAYPQLVYRGLIYELESFDELRRISRPLRDNSAHASTDIFHAARWGNTSAVRRFLRFGARVEGTDAWSMTPLAWAALRGHADTVAVLLAAKADPNRPTGSLEWTPLMFGVLGGNADIVLALLGHGAKADVHIAADIGPSHALTIAANMQRPDLVELLLSHGANPNFVDEERTPLENASRRLEEHDLLDRGARAQRDELGEDKDWYRVSALGRAGLAGHSMRSSSSRRAAATSTGPTVTATIPPRWRARGRATLRFTSWIMGPIPMPAARSADFTAGLTLCSPMPLKRTRSKWRSE